MSPIFMNGGDGKRGMHMPAAITHYYHVLRVLELWKPDTANRDALLWGAQGPDFLFYHRVLPWQKGESLSVYGERLHQEEVVQTLSILRGYAESHPSEIVKSYIAGFLCHYAADRTCHPFVRAHAHGLLQVQPEQDEQIAHHELESALDVILLRYEAGALPIEFSLKKTLPKDPQVEAEIATLYAFLLHVRFGVPHAKPLVEQAIRDAHTALGWLNDRTSLKKSLVERWEKKHGGKHLLSCHIRGVGEGDDFDYANTLLGTWRWPENGEPKNESFFDVYERSIQDALELINGFFAGIDLDKLTGGRSFG